MLPTVTTLERLAKKAGLVFVMLLGYFIFCTIIVAGLLTIDESFEGVEEGEECGYKNTVTAGSTLYPLQAPWLT